MKINIALAQIETVLGDVQSNLDKQLSYINQAISKNAELIIFPELSLTGYLLQDLASDVAISPTTDDKTFQKLIKASKDIDIATSFVENVGNDKFYISAAYLSSQKILHIHKKIYLPTYGMFDEQRFFFSGNQVRAFDTRFGRFGMLICEDFWHASPPYILWQDGAQLMILMSASPSRGLGQDTQLSSAKWVDHINKAYASLFSSFVAHTNKVGFEDGINFWGGATIHGPDGKLIVKAPEHEEALTIQEIDLEQISQVRGRMPLHRDERAELVLNELSRITKSKN